MLVLFVGDICEFISKINLDMRYFGIIHLGDKVGFFLHKALNQIRSRTPKKIFTTNLVFDGK